MAEEIEWDYALKNFLGSKKAKELKDKVKDYYFNPKYWRDDDYFQDRVIRFDDPQDRVIKAYVCTNKTYKVEVVNLHTKEWKHVPDDCLGIFVYFPYKRMSEKQIKERFERQWKANTNNARITYGLLYYKKF